MVIKSLVNEAMTRNIFWEKEPGTFLLKNDGEILISLNYQPISGSVFKIAGKTYRIEKSGVWTTIHTIFSEERPILKLTQGFWGTKGNILFNDGSTFHLNYSNKTGFRLSFLDDQGTELLYYQTLFENKRPKISFNLGITLIDADKLLVLSALGFALFYPAFSENSSGEDSLVLLTFI